MQIPLIVVDRLDHLGHLEVPIREKVVAPITATMTDPREVLMTAVVANTRSHTTAPGI